MPIKIQSSDTLSVELFETKKLKIHKRRRNILFNSLFTKDIYHKDFLTYKINLPSDSNKIYVMKNKSYYDLVVNAIHDRAGHYKKNINFEYISIHAKAPKFFRPLYREHVMLDYIVKDIFDEIPDEVEQYIQKLKKEFDYSTKAADVDQKKLYRDLLFFILSLSIPNKTIILTGFDSRHLDKLNKDNKYILLSNLDQNVHNNELYGFQTISIINPDNEEVSLPIIPFLKIVNAPIYNDSARDNNATPTISDISYSFTDIDIEHANLSLSILIDNNGLKNTKCSLGWSLAHDRKNLGHFRLFSYNHEFLLSKPTTFSFNVDDIKFRKINYYLFLTLFVDDIKVWKVPVPMIMTNDRSCMNERSIGSVPPDGFVGSSVTVTES